MANDAIVPGTLVLTVPNDVSFSDVVPADDIAAVPIANSLDHDVTITNGTVAVTIPPDDFDEIQLYIITGTPRSISCYGVAMMVVRFSLRRIRSVTRVTRDVLHDECTSSFGGSSGGDSDASGRTGYVIRLSSDGFALAGDDNERRTKR